MIDVKLQAALAGAQGTFSYNNEVATSWTLIVFPTASGGVPAVGGVGLTVLVAVLLGVGAFIITRRHQASAT